MTEEAYEMNETEALNNNNPENESPAGSTLNMIPVLRQLLMEYYPDVVRYLQVFSINPEFVKDAIQETMVEAFANVHKVRDISKLKNWLIKIAQRTGMRYENTARQCENILTNLENAEDEGALPIRNTIGIHNELDRAHLWIKVKTVLNKKEYKVMVLRFIYGYKLKEISFMLGENYCSVRSMSARAQKKLRKILKSESTGR